MIILASPVARAAAVKSSLSIVMSLLQYIDRIDSRKSLSAGNMSFKEANQLGWRSVTIPFTSTGIALIWYWPPVRGHPICLEIREVGYGDRRLRDIEASPNRYAGTWTIAKIRGVTKT